MANLSVRRLDEEVVRRLKARAARESVSMEEEVRRILRQAVMAEEPLGSAIRRIVGDDGVDLELARREAYEPVDFDSPAYGREGE